MLRCLASSRAMHSMHTSSAAFAVSHDRGAHAVAARSVSLLRCVLFEAPGQVLIPEGRGITEYNGTAQKIKSWWKELAVSCLCYTVWLDPRSVVGVVQSALCACAGESVCFRQRVSLLACLCHSHAPPVLTFAAYCQFLY